MHPSLLSSFRTFLSPHKKTGTHQSSHSFLLPFPQSWQSSVRFLHHISFVLGLLLILFLLSPPQSSETSQTGEPPGPSESLARVVMYGCAGCSLHNSVWLSWSLGSFDGAEAESGVSRSWRRGARGGEPDLEGCMARPHPPQPPAHPKSSHFHTNALGFQQALNVESGSKGEQKCQSPGALSEEERKRKGR